VELGEGIQATCRIDKPSPAVESKPQAEPVSYSKLDLSSLGSMLQARWKGGAPAEGAKPEPVRAGQIRKFRIVNLDTAAKKIELELA
jgi:small subunit ribosomal protein S1